MDAAVIGLGVTLGTAIVGVTLYAAKARGTAEGAMHKARNVEQAHTAYIAHADAVFVRKETIAPQLATITATLERIERNQEALTQRFMDGAVGS